MSKELLEKMENIAEFKSILESFWKDFEETREKMKTSGDKVIIYDKYENKYHTCKLTDEEIENYANQDLVNDNTGWFDETVLSSETGQKLVSFFRTLAKEKYNL